MATVRYKGSRLDTVLTKVSLKYKPEGFIANMLLTPLTVGKWTGLIGSYGTAHLQLVNSRVFDRGEYRTVPTVDRNITTNYNVGNHGLKDLVTERDIEEVEEPFMARNDVTEGLRNLLITEKEYAVASLLRNLATYPTGSKKTLSGNSQWSDFENSDPISDIKDAKQVVWDKAKRKPNFMILPYDVSLNLKFHPKLTGIYGQSGTYTNIDMEQIRRVFGIQNMLIPEAAYVNSNGVETAFWGKDVIIGYADTRAMREQRTFGYRIMKSGHESRVFSREASDAINTEKILSDMAYQYMITNANCGYLIQNAIV